MIFFGNQRKKIGKAKMEQMNEMNQIQINQMNNTDLQINILADVNYEVNSETNPEQMINVSINHDVNPEQGSFLVDFPEDHIPIQQERERLEILRRESIRGYHIIFSTENPQQRNWNWRIPFLED